MPVARADWNERLIAALSRLLGFLVTGSAMSGNAACSLECRQKRPQINKWLLEGKYMIHTAAHEALSSHVWCLREQIARDGILASEGSQQFAASTEEKVLCEPAGPPMNFKEMSPLPTS